MRLFLQKMYETLSRSLTRATKTKTIKNEKIDEVSIFNGGINNFLVAYIAAVTTTLFGYFQKSCDSLFGMKLLSQNNRFKVNAFGVLTLVLLFGVNEMRGQAIVTFPTTWSGIPTTVNASTVATNIITPVTCSRGSSLTAGSSGARFNSSGWSGSASLSLAGNNSYLTFTVTASTGYKLNLNSSTLSFGLGSSGTGPTKYGIYTNVGGFTSTANQIGSDLTTSSTSVTFPSTGYNGLASIVIRIYGWGASTPATGTGGFSNLSLTGTVVSDVATPTISGTATATAFTTTYGTPSTAQTFAVSGSNLTANLVATAPTGYEVSADGTTYGSTATFTQTSGTASGSLRIRLAATATVTGNNYNAQTIALTSAGATTVNITTAASGNTVSAKALTISGLTATSKVYDGILTAAFNGTAAYSGLVNGDTFASVSGTPSASFVTKTVGSAKPVTFTGYTTPSSNYTVSQPTGITANITAAPLTITGAAVTTKSFDGSTSATITGTLTGLLGSDVVTFASGTSAFASANPGAGIAVTAGCTLSGADASNYILTQPTGLTGTIDAIVNPTISVSPTTTAAFTTTYGTASASQSFTVTGSSLSNDITVNAATGFEVATDNATFGTSVTFTPSSGSVSATLYIRLAASNSVSGSYNNITSATFTSTDASTVSLTTPSTGNSVTAKALTITGITAVSKVYDGILTAAFNGTASYSGLVNGDTFTSVSGTPSASFATKTVGTAKSVTISGYTAPSSNYSVAQPTGLTADITAAPLTITNATVTSKTYNGTTPATITGTLTGVVSGDTVTFASGTSAFASADAGTGIAVNSACTISGADAGNYTLTQPTGLAGTISLANQTITGLAATASKSTTDAAYTLTATASSGLTVTYTSSNTAVATISGATVTIVGAGTTTITAIQAGNSNYNTATSITQTLTVAALPSVLTAGDIAVVSLNSGTPDSFAVVLLKAINAGTVINFTDNGFTGTDIAGRTGEGFLTFTAPTALPYGTILTWTNGITGTGWSSNAPTNFSFNSAGDQLFIFQGNTSNWASQSGITLLFGINYVGALSATSAATATLQPNTSILPTTAFLNLATASNANGYYSGNGLASTTVTLCGSTASILSNIITPAKWLGTTGTIATFPTYTVTSVCPPTVAATGSLTAFTSTYGTASASQTVSVSGSNLTADLVATAPAGYEISYNGTSWGSTATFTQTSGIATGTLNVRLASTATVSGAYNSKNIVLSSTSATSVNITTTSTGNTVSPLGITISGLTGVSKIYDGTASATLSGTATYTGLVNGDTFTSVSGSPVAVFNTKNVGTGKTITITGYITPSTNYTVTQPTASADITAKEVTLSAIVAHDKVYDGDYPTTVSATLNGVVSPDNVTLVSSAVFIDGPYVGNFGVTASFSLNGTDINNYTLIQPDTSSLTANITPKSLTISNPVASNKEYDGTTTATISGTLVGVVTTSGEVVTLNGSYGTFATSGIGVNIVVTPTWMIDGDTYNYTLVEPTNVITANITSPGSPSITSTLVASANYGATSTSYSITTNISATSYTASGLPDGLSINTATGEITGAPTTAGTFNVTLGANGIGGTGYATLVYTISPITLTVSGAYANDKSYDGTTAATINGTLIGVINSDDVALNGVGTFDSFNVASNIYVTSNSNLTGTKASNYIIENPTGLVANITPKSLSFTASVSDKVYDRTNTATVALASINGVVGLDEVTATIAGTFDTVTAGNNKSVTITSLTLGGANAANYSVTTPTGVTGNITQKPLTVTATANNKVYDGTDTATITVSATTGVITPDVVTVTGGGTFASTAIATNISVTPNLVLGGADATNYTLTQPTGLTANILIVPTTLSAGDIAIVGYNAGGSPDNFAIVVLKDLNSGTQFFVSDNEVATAGGTTFTDLNEGEASFTVKAGQSIAAGTVIVLPCTTAASTTTYDWNSPSTLNLSSGSDELYIYTATSITATTPTQFIYYAKLGGSSSVPNGLTLGYTSIAPTAAASRYSTTGNIYNSCKSILLTEIGKTANWNTTGATTIASSDWTFTVLPTCPTPAITATGTLTGLTTIYGSASATTTSFSLNGSYLTNSITITAPTGFEVSTSAASGFASTITIAPTSGSVASTTIFVRLSATTTVLNSPYSGDIVCSSTGATAINVATASSTVTPKSLTISGVLVVTKVQSIGDFSATLSGTPVLTGVLSADTANVTIGGTAVANFAQDTAGTNISVAITGYSISGSASGNYTLEQPSLTGTISSVASPVITSALTFTSVYGTIASTYTITATTDASYPITTYNAIGLPSGVTVDTTTGEISGTPTGTLGNYTVTISATNAGGTTNAYLIYSITAKTLTVSGATASSKVYNGTTATTIIGYSLNGIYGSDVVTASGTGVFSDKNIGIGKTVIGAMALNGIDAAKYTLIQPTGLTADITPITLSLFGVSAQNKVYDGTNVATITATLGGVVTGNSVTFNGTGVFASSDIAQGIAVTSTATLSGADAGNYIFVQPIGLTANITDPVIYLNTFTGVSACPTNGNIPSMATNSTGTAVTRNTTTCTVAANVFNSTTLNNTSSVNTASYIEFSVNAAIGYQLNLRSMSFFRQASGTAPNKLEVRYSTDGFATSTSWGAAPNSPTTGTVATWDFADFSTLMSGTITFRIYPYGTQKADNTGSASASGSFRVDDVTVYGTVSLATPPTSAVLSGSATVCSGSSSNLHVAITDGTSPYTVVYNNGTSNSTVNNYTNGANIPVSPSNTTTYSLVSVTDANGFTSSNLSGSAVITVNGLYPFYSDADGDGYGTGSTVTLCAVNATTPPIGYSVNNTDCNDSLYSATNNCSSIVNLKLNIQGYYDSATHAMRSVMANQGIGSSATDVDDVTVELHNSSTFDLVATTTGRLQTDGTVVAAFATAPSGSFYIAVTYKNAIPTWSATAQTVGTTPLTYDFTTSASKAYGDNMVEVAPGVFGFYSGDISQDEFIDLFDYTPWETDYNESAVGQYATDLNGDGFVDLSDFTIWETNYNGSVVANHPSN